MNKNSILAAVFLLLSGCASFPGDKVAKVESLPDVSSYKVKPSVTIDLKFFRGKPTDANAIEITQVSEKLKPLVSSILDESSLFESYSYDLFNQEASDYVVKLHLFNHGNGGGAAISGFISGFTFGVIPGFATDNYTLKAEVVEGEANVYSGFSDDTIKKMVGIWFIPAMANTQQKAFDEVTRNMIKNALKEMVESNQLKYAFRQKHSLVNEG